MEVSIRDKEDDTCPDCGERIEDACLTSCLCARCEQSDLEADLDRAAYLAQEDWVRFAEECGLHVHGTHQKENSYED
jgi:hypothetical protein